MIDARNSAIGFDSGRDVSPGEVVNLEASPKGFFKVSRLLVGKGAESFRIEDVTVDGVSQMPARGGVPAVAFSENAIGPGFDMATCKPGGKIVLSALNTSDTPARFVAAAYGKSSNRLRAPPRPRGAHV